MIYEFENCTLDTSTQELRRDGELVAVQPQVFAVLEYLLTNAGRVVSKIELLDEVWGDRFVSEAALTSRIKLARQACGDSGRDQRVVKTVHGRGYRMVATIRQRGGTPVAAAVDSRGPAAVGRDDEIARLRRAADSAVAGVQTTVLVTGPAGAGKSTVVAEFVEQADDLDRWLLLRGRCHRSRSGPEPYFALLDALGSLATTEPALVRDTLDRVAPSWLLQLPTLVDDAAAERLERRLLGGARQRMLREGADVFLALARQQPTIVVLEDLHQADECTLDVLELLSSRRDPVPLLLVATARPGTDQVDSLVAELGAAGSAELLPIGPLDREAVGRLLEEVDPEVSVDPALVELVHARCGGNPLFALEILNAWAVAGLTAVAAGVLTATADADALAATIPAGLVHLVDRSLDDLAVEERSVLEAAAAVGLDFDAASVAAGLERPLAEVEDVLARMARRSEHIDAVSATTWPDGTVSTAYRFVHQLHRDVIHEQTAAARRVSLHRRIGLALETGHRSAPHPVVARLADHFVISGDAARAARYLRRVGSQAISRQAHGHAVDVLAQALEQCARLEPGPARDTLELEIQLSLGQARVGVAGWFDAAVGEHYERALTLARDLGATDEEAHARYALATISEMSGDFETTEHLLVPVLSDDDDELDIEAHELIACSTFHRGAFERSARNAASALAAGPEDAPSEVMARVAEHPATSCNSWLSLTNWFLGRSDDSLRRADDAVRLGERHRYALGTAMQQRAMLHQLRGEPEACRHWADRALALERPDISGARSLQASVLRDWAQAIAGPRTSESADGVLERMDLAVRRVCDSSVWLDAPYYLALLADVLLHHGDARGALAALDRATTMLESEARGYFHRSEIHRLRARAVLASGEADGAGRARADLDESLALAEAMGSPVLTLRATCDRLELEAGHGDAAPWREQLGALLGRYDGQDPPPDVVRGRALLDA